MKAHTHTTTDKRKQSTVKKEVQKMGIKREFSKEFKLSVLKELETTKLIEVCPAREGENIGVKAPEKS